MSKLSIEERFDRPRESLVFELGILQWPNAGGSHSIWNLKLDKRAEIKNFRRGRDHLVFNVDGSRAVVSRRKDGTAELWSIDENKLIRSLDVTHVTEERFTDDQKAVLVRVEGNEWRAFDLQGTLLGKMWLQTTRFRFASYQEQCNRFLFWTDEGLVLSVQRGWSVAGLFHFAEASCPG